MRILPIVLLAGTTACFSVGPDFDGSVDSEMLRDETWTLTLVKEPDGPLRSVDVLFDAVFRSSGTMSGYAGPNTWSGEYSVHPDGHLHLEAGPRTLIGGPEAEASARHHARFFTAERFAVTEDELRLHLADGGFLHFRR